MYRCSGDSTVLCVDLTSRIDRLLLFRSDDRREKMILDSSVDLASGTEFPKLLARQYDLKQ